MDSKKCSRTSILEIPKSADLIRASASIDLCYRWNAYCNNFASSSRQWVPDCATSRNDVATP